MPEHETAPRRSGRRWLVALIVLGAFATGGALLLRHYLRAEKLTALLIDQTRGMLGADLALDGVAHFDFSPNLHLVLPKPRLKALQGDGVLLGADSVDVVVPWHTLWNERLDIESIHLVRPVLDVDAVSAWLAAQPAGAPMPDVRFALRADDATVMAGGRRIAQGVDVSFANAADLAAWFANLRSGKAGSSLLPPLAGSAEARSLQIGTTRIEGVRVEMRDDASEPSAPARP